ncbi:hypothetical protein SAMN05192543_11234 [Paraburkholderia megapolitana]|uniref:Uncharacterized protein n=1 Tax=Paraburkholderia megapolitana TaxID=420953 RepID=A0A1I3UT15_9BURK|nr:hypothetical protein SAMN05192543_11234 [Paraburkholderia megapolitana]
MRIDSVKQFDRFTGNHSGRSAGMFVVGYCAMGVAPSS